MTLLIDELYPGIVFEQNFRIKKSIQVAHFRPWIYKHGILDDGDLTLEILKDDEVLKTTSINYEIINLEIPGTYAHGQIRFDVHPLQLNHDRKEEWTEYTAKLYMANHTKNTNKFMAAVRRYELKIYDTYGNDVTDGESVNDMVEPLGFELYNWRY